MYMYVQSHIYIYTYVSMYILLHIFQYMYCILHTITLLHTVLLCIIQSLIIHPRPWCCSAWEVVVDRVEYFDRPKSWRHSLPSMDVYGWIWENRCLRVTWKPCFFFPNLPSCHAISTISIGLLLPVVFVSISHHPMLGEMTPDVIGLWTGVDIRSKCYKGYIMG